MKILLITEGSEFSGLGHLSRVKSFASNILDFSEIEIQIVAKIEKELFPIFNDISENVWFTQCFSNVSKQIDTFKPNIIIFDLLIIDRTFFWKLKKKGYKFVSFSPIFSHLEFVDIVFTRGNLQIPKGPKVFSGIEYVIIGNHVKSISDKIYNSNLNTEYLPISVSLGGTDAPNKTLNVLRKLVKFEKSLLIWVLLGEGYRHSYTELVSVIKQNPMHEIILARTNKSMWKILENTVIAIVSGGLTAYELAFAGLPTINIVEKKEHEALLLELIKTGSTINLGVISKLNNQILLESIRQVYLNKQRLLDMRSNGQKLNIGQGTSNILKVLNMYMSK